MNTDPRVDTYIAKAPSFAQPILTEIRARLRKVSPAAEETIKWNVPFYVLDGKLLASMAAFKKHAKVGIWANDRPELMDVTTVAELPPAKTFADRVKAAAARIGGGAPPAPAKKASTKGASTKKTSTKTAAPKKASTKKISAKKASTKTAAAKKATRNR